MQSECLAWRSRAAAWICMAHCCRYDIHGNVRVASQNEKLRSVQINCYILFILFGTALQTGSHKDFEYNVCMCNCLCVVCCFFLFCYELRWVWCVLGVYLWMDWDWLSWRNRQKSQVRGPHGPADRKRCILSYFIDKWCRAYEWSHIIYASRVSLKGRVIIKQKL